MTETGVGYYAENKNCNLTEVRNDPWLLENVIPHLHGPVKLYTQIANDLRVFCGESPEFWGYYSAHDFVVLCGLYGGLMQRPQGWPPLCFDVAFLAEQKGLRNTLAYEGIHNPLVEAQWIMQLFSRFK